MNPDFPDAILALGYFCENDGARVVMTTQALRPTKVQHYPNVDDVDIGTDAGKRQPSTVDESPKSGSSREENASRKRKTKAESSRRIEVLSVTECGRGRGQDVFSPQVTDHDLVFATWNPFVEHVDDEERCPACTSFGPRAAHLFNDFSAHRSYITTQTAINDDAFDAAKSACLRMCNAEKLIPLESLENGEVNQSMADLAETATDHNGEGLMVFIKVKNKYSGIGRVFTLKDAKSRGFKRQYVLLFISQNHKLIAWKYRKIIDELNVVADFLKAAADNVHDREQIVDPSKFLQLKRISDNSGRETPAIQIDTKRSFSCIVNNNEIFVNLHRDFVAILKNVLSTGPPVPRKARVDRLAVSRLAEITSKAMAIGATANLLSIFHSMRKDKFAVMVCHLCRGGQIVCQSNNAAVRSQFLFALTPLIPGVLVNIASNKKNYVFGVNLLGVSDDVVLPTTDQFDLMIIRPLKKCRQSEGPVLADCEFYVDRMPSNAVIEPLPSVIVRYMSVLRDLTARTTISTLHEALTTIKSEFMALTIDIASTYPSTARVAALLRAFSKPPTDLDVYQFWKLASIKLPPTRKLTLIEEERVVFIPASVSSGKTRTQSASIPIPIPISTNVAIDVDVDMYPESPGSSLPSVFSASTSTSPGYHSTGSYTSSSPVFVTNPNFHQYQLYGLPFKGSNDTDSNR